MPTGPPATWHATPSSTSSTQSPPPKAVTLATKGPNQQFPLVVRVNLFPWRKIRIENKGRAAIDEVSLAIANFTLDYTAYMQRRVVIQSANFPMYSNDGILLEKSIRPGNHIEKDIKSFLISGHNSFDESLKNPDLPQSEYGARITFRDSQTGQKYACYKVFSSIDGNPEPWGDLTSSVGPPDKIDWLMDVPKLIIAAMKDHYQDGAIEFGCER